MKKIIIIAGSVLVVAVIGVVLFLFLGSKDKEEEPPQEFTFTLSDAVYTNIMAGDEEGSYKILKIKVSIVYTQEEYLEVLTAKEPIIKDFINGYFRDVTMTSVNKKNGKERIKEDVKELLIELLDTDSENITNVIFPEFIIQ